MSKIITIDLRRINTLHTRQTVMHLIELHTKHWFEYKATRRWVRLAAAIVVAWGVIGGWDEVNLPLLFMVLALRLAFWAIWFIFDSHIRKSVLTIKNSEFYR